MEPPTRTTSSIISVAQLGVFEGLFNGNTAAVQQVRTHFLKLSPRQSHVEVLRSFLGGGDEGKIDRSLGGAGKFDFGFLSGFGQSLQCLLIFAEVDAFIALEFVSNPIHYLFVEVVTAEVGVAASGFDFKNAIAHFQNGNVEGATAEVKDENGFIALFV